MTYPPQPGSPYGQQPGPYGQGSYPQQPGGFAQHGGYPQPGGYTQHGGYPRQGASGPGGFGGPPPKKRKTGLIVWLSGSLVVVLGALAITGFAWPGFFVGEEEGRDPESAAKALTVAVNDHDKQKLRELTCTSATRMVRNVIDDIDRVDGIKLRDQPKAVSETEATATVEITVSGETAPYEGALGKEGDRWCWKDLDPASGSLSGSGPSSSTPSSSKPVTPGPPSSLPSRPAPPGGTSGGPTAAPSEPRRAEPPSLINDFIAAVNDGDAAGAKAMRCPGSSTNHDVEDVVAGGFQLTAESPAGAGDVFISDLRGARQGQSLVGMVTAHRLVPGRVFCISTFHVY